MYEATLLPVTGSAALVTGALTGSILVVSLGVVLLIVGVYLQVRLRKGEKALKIK